MVFVEVAVAPSSIELEVGRTLQPRLARIASLDRHPQLQQQGDGRWTEQPKQSICWTSQKTKDQIRLDFVVKWDVENFAATW